MNVALDLTNYHEKKDQTTLYNLVLCIVLTYTLDTNLTYALAYRLTTAVTSFAA